MSYNIYLRTVRGVFVRVNQNLLSIRQPNCHCSTILAHTHQRFLFIFVLVELTYILLYSSSYSAHACVFHVLDHIITLSNISCRLGRQHGL